MRENLSYHKRNLTLESESQDKRLLHEVRILYRLLPATQWIDVAAVALVFGLLIKYVDITSLLIWALFVSVIISVRISIRERYDSAVLTTENVATWLNWFLVGATLYGAMWSVTAILLIPSNTPTVAAFTALILCGLTAAGVAVSSVNMKAFTLYTLATLWPYSFYLIASENYPQTTIGALIFLFSFVVFIMGLRTYHFFSNMVSMELKSNNLEMELQYEIKKRKLAENALLDNTLEEELADKIRQQSLALKEGSLRENAYKETLNVDHSTYLNLLNSKIKNQLQNTLVFVRDLEEANLPEHLKKEVNIITKILTNIISSIKKVTLDNEQVRQEMLEIDLDDEDHQPLNIRRMVNYLVQAIPLVYKAKYITINRKIDKNVPNSIYGNKKALHKILSNLITNAVKYSDGGNVNISIENVTAAPDKLVLKIVVADTGVGMPREVVDFLQNEKTEQAGLYPGLAVVKHLTTKYGNNIGVKSTLGVGTEIEFHMQFKSENMASA